MYVFKLSVFDGLIKRVSSKSKSCLYDRFYFALLGFFVKHAHLLFEGHCIVLTTSVLKNKS